MPNLYHWSPVKAYTSDNGVRLRSLEKRQGTRPHQPYGDRKTMARRASWVTSMVNSWVNRTPSGLPLCSTCNKELGFCPHSPTLREDTSVDDKERKAAAHSAPAGSGEAMPDTGAVPLALRINEAGQSHQSASLEERPKHGTKRRPSAVLQGKGKRRSVLVQAKVGWRRTKTTSQTIERHPYYHVR